MRITTCLPVAAFVALGLTRPFLVESVAQSDQKSTLTVVKVPHIVLPPHAPDSPEIAARIRNLVTRLSEIDTPDFGLSPTTSGSTFAPVADSGRSSAFVLGAQRPRTAPALLELVKLGPIALPYLLASLDDRTPTKLTMKRDGILMWTDYGRELGGNPGNELEKRVLGAIPSIRSSPGEGPNIHTVTVGDVCFVIIGQIVGRKYSAVRYQPTGGLIINSPTHDPRIAKAVRDIWSSPNPEQHLVASLLIDYSSRGVHRGRADGLDDWYSGSELQVAAVMRLLYYFPRQAAPLVAGRLRRLQVADTSEAETSKHRRSPDRWAMRELANGVGTNAFIEATAWCSRLEVQTTLVTLLARSNDPEIAVACLSGKTIAKPAMIRAKLSALLRIHADDPGPFGNAYHLLLALGRLAGPEAKQSFQEFLRNKRVDHVRAAAHALSEVRHEWAIELLSPFLSDVRTFGWTHGPERSLIRICDEVADTLSRTNRELSFRMEGTSASKDKQIRALRASIKVVSHAKSDNR